MYEWFISKTISPKNLWFGKKYIGQKKWLGYEANVNSGCCNAWILCTVLSFPCPVPIIPINLIIIQKMHSWVSQSDALGFLRVHTMRKFQLQQLSFKRQVEKVLMILHFHLIHLTSAELSKNSIFSKATSLHSLYDWTYYEGNHLVKFGIFKIVMNHKATA